MAIAVTGVKAGPAGLVVVTLRLEDGTVRRMVLPKRLAGVAEVEWSAQAVQLLSQLSQATP